MGLVYVNRKRLLFDGDYKISLSVWHMAALVTPSPPLYMSKLYKKHPGGRGTIFHGFYAFFLPQSAAWQVPEKSVADVGQCVNKLGQYVPMHGKSRRGDHKKLTLYL